jgi:hypothetical protein
MSKSFSKRIKKYEKILLRYEKKLKKVQNYRVFSFLSFFLFSALLFNDNLFLIPSILSIVLFIYLIKDFNKLELKIKYLQAKILFFTRNQARLDVDWEKLDVQLDTYPKEGIYLDFDLFGERSLFNLIALNASKIGNQRLKEYFINYKNDKDLRGIEDTISELKEHKSLHSHFFAKSKLAKLNEFEIKKYFDWLNKKHELSILDKMIKFLPLISILLFILKYSSVFYGILFFQFAYVILRQETWRDIYWNVLDKHAVFTVFSEQIQFIRKRHFKSNILKKLFKNLDRVNYLDELEKLNKRLSLAFNSLLYIIINTFTFWDIWYCEKLIKWKNEYANRLPDDLSAIAEFEYYLSLSNFSNVFPNYSFADFTGDKLICEEIGHPFISRTDSVKNNFEIEDGQIAIITGSNMAGKTTFLRTIAVNLFLASLGAPVAAKKLVYHRTDLLSSIKISDSLNDGVSFFYAEVKRLKEIITSFEESENGIIFIDEMLKGTNNRERSIASKNIISQLVEKKATGFFSTHDLELIHLEDEFKGKIINYHFAESDDSESLTFDFKIKNGPVKSTNAIKILTKEGLYK